MPYIKSEDREQLIKELPKNCGELNYYITMLIKDYWQKTGNYQGINDIVGALEGAKLEFTRQVTNKYEDSKIEQNGKVYQ